MKDSPRQAIQSSTRTNEASTTILPYERVGADNHKQTECKTPKTNNTTRLRRHNKTKDAKRPRHSNPTQTEDTYYSKAKKQQKANPDITIPRHRHWLKTTPKKTQANSDTKAPQKQMLTRNHPKADTYRIMTADIWRKTDNTPHPKRDTRTKTKKRKKRTN